MFESESKWAPIVYGRTYEVDFRFIVTPQDFYSKEIEWAAEYIRVTTRTAEKLHGNPRWLLVKDDQYCMVGVTCMVSELINYPTSEESEDITRDSQGRPLYVFVGYVAKNSSKTDRLSFPTIPSMNLELFERLYTHVRQRWSEPSYTTSRQEMEGNGKIAYEEVGDTFTAIEAVNLSQISPRNLNYQDENSVYLWQNLDNQNLWNAASWSDYPVSVCLELASEKDFLNSPFMNGTALDIISHRVVDKQKVRGSDQVQNLSKDINILVSGQVDQQAQDYFEEVKPHLRNRSRFNATENLEILGNMIGENLDTLGNIILDKSKAKIDQRWREVREKLDGVWLEFEREQKKLGETQTKLGSRKYREAQIILREVNRKINWRDYIEAEKELDDAIALIKEITVILQQRHIDFRPKQEHSQADHQASDSLWEMD